MALQHSSYPSQDTRDFREYKVSHPNLPPKAINISSSTTAIHSRPPNHHHQYPVVGTRLPIFPSSSDSERLSIGDFCLIQIIHGTKKKLHDIKNGTLVSTEDKIFRKRKELEEGVHTQGYTNSKARYNTL